MELLVCEQLPIIIECNMYNKISYSPETIIFLEITKEADKMYMVKV